MNALCAVLCASLGACASRGPVDDLVPMENPPPAMTAELPPLEAGAPPIRWPLSQPQVSAYFGWRKKRMHEGVDLHARTGTPVMAAAAGRVVYVGRKVRNYGKMVVIDHGHGWSTVYAHLSAYKVKVGNQVQSGQLIALSGRTGRVSGPHLHFEVRRGADPLDPLLFLPSKSIASEAH